ncbi:hypothetical protein GCM10010149_88780 [Nonomuraea roseoviolacea subsp. roseoviolacea]|uniref:hypothetical protein n=1 Tax=Nonomuraea roseoviolacea TaxID=103837 RepID=UPI0031D259AA
MADRTTTQFPKMGDDARNWENISVKASTDLRTPRKGYSMVEGAFANHRAQRFERGGHKGAIQARVSYPNSPEAGATQHNTRTVPSSKGNTDFWAKRNLGQVQQ